MRKSSVGAAVFQLPFMYLFTRVPMNVLIPSESVPLVFAKKPLVAFPDTWYHLYRKALDILWGIVTLIQYRTTSYSEMMAYRFLVGALEASFFPAVHWVLGSWYRRDEIGRRGGVFYLGWAQIIRIIVDFHRNDTLSTLAHSRLSLGQLTAGLLQASIINHMEGYLGLRAWRWNFIVAGIMTIPIGFVSFDLPTQPTYRPNDCLKACRRANMQRSCRRATSSGPELPTRRGRASDVLCQAMLQHRC